MGKVIVIDLNIFTFRAVFAWEHNRAMSMPYIVYNMLLSALSKIGVDPTDEIIVAIDGKGNWRKDYEPNYKGNRKEQRESHEGLDWKDIFNKWTQIKEQIDKGTDWHIVQLDKIEADDIASVVCRYYKDKEIILCSYDKDWEMLLHYPRVKVFSILKKYKSKKGAYKIPAPRFSAYKLLASKIKKEVSDNLVDKPTTEQGYENRKKCVNLLELPEYIESQIVSELDKLSEKSSDINYIPFQNIRKRIESLYNDTDKIVTYADCVKYEQKKKDKKKRRSKS